MMQKDSLGDRMKHQYEDITRYQLPRRTYTIIRVDGKAFHTLTQNAVRPYDCAFASAMDSAAAGLCQEVQGAKFAYVQSDEISILTTDFEKEDTAAWFDGNLQKICSVAAACATAHFNANYHSSRLAMFDARVFTIPDYVEVENYFIWRQKDAERNSISMLAQSHASHKELHGKNIAAQHDVIHNAGDNWNDHPTWFKRGRIAFPNGLLDHEIPVFTKHRSYLEFRIPKPWPDDFKENIHVI